MPPTPLHASAESAGQIPPTMPPTIPAVRLLPRNLRDGLRVGDFLHGTEYTRADAALEQQIAICAKQSAIEERAGRMDVAREWSLSMLDAIKARRPEWVRALEAEEREWLDSLDYFSSDAAHQGRTAG